MAYPNTGAAQSNTHVYGSAKIEISEDGGSNCTNFGLARGVSVTENIEMTRIQADNGPDLSEYVSDHTITLGFNALEMYLPTWYKARGGLSTLSVTSADATTDTDVYTTGSLDSTAGYIIWLQNQGASDTLPAIDHVASQDTDGVETTLDDTRDYEIITDSGQNYKRGIVLLSAAQGGKFSDTEGLRINYVYGAINTRKLASGGLSNVSGKWYKLTLKELISGSYKYRYIYIYNATINTGLSLAFKSCNEADGVLETPFEIMGKLDLTRSAGDQLWAIHDEVATS